MCVVYCSHHCCLSYLLSAYQRYFVVKCPSTNKANITSSRGGLFPDWGGGGLPMASRCNKVEAAVNAMVFQCFPQDTRL